MNKQDGKSHKLLRNSKSQGISINTIIIAAIALLVLVVLVMVFTGKIGGFGAGVDNCVAKGGNCNIDAANPCPANSAELPNTDCPAAKKCCIPI